uniref:Protein hunchback n=1 Tax=Steinernema glaseri TaxID=37863 RepID=A0A1I7Y4D4_9BILA
MDSTPQQRAVTSEALFDALQSQMPLTWGNQGLRLPTVFNAPATQPSQLQQPPGWPALVAPTPIHPGNPLNGLLDNNLLASLFRLQSNSFMESEVKEERQSPPAQQPLTQQPQAQPDMIPEQNRLAALRLQEKIKNETQPLITPEASPPNSTYSRPSGQSPPTKQSPLTPDLLACLECGFTCNTKFHYNSHMNTHAESKCKICGYTCRTEGRVLKHMREAHSLEEQIAAGVEVVATSPPSPSRTPPNGMNALLEAAFGTSSSSPSPSKELSPENSEEKVFQIPVVPHLDVTPTTPKSGRKQKPKRYQCKHCDHVSTNKEQRYQHSKTHIPIEKQLCCPQCEFVTEYKHHLEYHIRNHYGSKPFTCEKCNYTCVNKSMLNSHLKSHSTSYQFKCQDCTYATKYCHSLKIHLRKYNHRRLITDDDLKGSSMAGSPPMGEEPATNSEDYTSLFNTAQMDNVNTLSGIVPCQVCGFKSDNSNEQMQHNLAHIFGTPSAPLSLPLASPAPLSVPISSSANNLLESLFTSTPVSPPTVSITQSEPVNVEVKVEVEDEPMEEVNEQRQEEGDQSNLQQICLDKLSQIQELQQQWRFKCEQCGISFQNENLFSMHAKCHGSESDFKCAACPFVAGDAVGFHEHLLQGHPSSPVHTTT